MVDFKKVPDGGETAITSEPHFLSASAAVPGTGQEGLFTLEQWGMIAIGGMALSLVMIVIGLVNGWRKSRRQKTRGD